MSKSPTSMRESLRESARGMGERYFDALKIDSRKYLKLLEEQAGIAKELSGRYLSTPESDGSEIAAHHRRRLDRWRDRERPPFWEPDFPPGRPPDERPFDELPEFPQALDRLCHYTSVVTLDTVARHTHTIDRNGETSDASFSDDLAAGVNLCTPAVDIVTMRPGTRVAEPTTAGFNSAFRFNFTPPSNETYRFTPAAFVNGFAFTLEVGGILQGIHVGPTWSTSLHLTIRVSQFDSGFYRAIEREVLRVDQTNDSSNEVIYDSTSDVGASLEAALDANQRVHVVIGLRAELRSPNSFPSVRFDGLEQYFKVPEVHVDKLECRTLGTRLVLP